MAEIIESTTTKVPSNGKVNAALTLGIIGTALGALGSGSGIVNGVLGRNGVSLSSHGNAGITNEELYLERRSYQNIIDSEKEYYADQQKVNERLVDAFFQSYKRDVNNSFMLYKNQRDEDDKLSRRIDEVDKKVDIMAAIRPYQDALIDNKIEKNALLAQYNLDKRTCRMITGQVVLPSDPTITGYGSYYQCPLQK